MPDYTIDKVNFFYKTVTSETKRSYYLYASVDYSYGKQDHGNVVLGLKDENGELIYICETTLDEGVSTSVELTPYEDFSYSTFEDQINEAVGNVVNEFNVERLEDSHVKDFIEYLNYEMTGVPNDIYNERDPFEYLYRE